VREGPVSTVNTLVPDRRHRFNASTTMLTVLSILWATSLMAEDKANAGNGLSEITVTSRMIIPDEEVSSQVVSALHSDLYVDDMHVTVTTKDGIVTLHGFVQDAWDLLALRRIAKKVAGAKKVVNDVELMLNDQ
jgi:hypothetical protein